MTCKQKKSSAYFDQAISPAAADEQISNSFVQEQSNTVDNLIFENHRSEMSNQNQQHAPQLIPQPSDLARNDDLIQQINQGSEEPELNNPISEVNNQNEGLQNNTMQFWQSLADQESAYYRGLFFQTNQSSLSLKGNAYANHPQNTGNLQTSSPAHDFLTAAYTPQHNRYNAFPAEAQLNHLAAQLEANLPAAAASPLHHQALSIPHSHFRPNLNTWTLANVPLSTRSNAFPIAPQRSNVNVTASLPVSVSTVGGTTYYHNPISSSLVDNQALQTAPLLPGYPPVLSPLPYSQNSLPMQHPSLPHSSASQQVTVKAELLSFSKRDPLPEWKLSQYNGDPLQWHEWCGQFSSAIDSQTLSDDVKLTYLKTMVTGKAKAAIAEFAYCASMYRDALKTLERKFGQPQAVVTAHLDKLSSYPQVKMHNSDSIIGFATVVSSRVGVFRSLSYDTDLRSSSLLNQAVQKLPPNLKEPWSMHTVKKEWLRPTMLDFNDWLKEKAEAHERMKAITFKGKN